jgi:hypothetical protein
MYATLHVPEIPGRPKSKTMVKEGIKFICLYAQCYNPGVWHLG